LHEWFRRAVQDRDLDRIYVDEDVVDAAGIDRREEVLGGGEENALFHEAGGVTHARYVVALRFDGKVIEVHAAKNDAGFGRRGDKPNVAVDTSMESHAFGDSRPGDGSLEHIHSQW